MEELSVLDYLKAKLTPWRGPAPEIPPLEGEGDQAARSEATAQAETEIADRDSGASEVVGGELSEGLAVQEQAPNALHETLVEEQAAARVDALPWRSVVAFGLALVAQVSLEPGPGRTWTVGMALYVAAALLLVWANRRAEWVLPASPKAARRGDPMSVKTAPFLVGLPLLVFAFLAFGGNRFTPFNTSLWLIGAGLMIWSFWLPSPRSVEASRGWWQSLSERKWRLDISWWTILVLGSVILVLGFRFYRMSSVPPEMVSDHAEKLLDIWDVLHGQTRIFFPRNTGREAMQMYMTAGIIQLFHTGYSHVSLKIGTVLAGVLTLPFIYLLGLEVANRRAGLLAVIFAGIGYWPNVISRVGLRFPLYPLFVAPVLYFLIRGIRRANRNDFVLSGVFLGIGLHGYTPIRILPLVVLAAAGLYLIHRQSRGFRRQTVFGVILLAGVALVFALPLVRYTLSNPEMVAFRAISRLGSVERPLPGSPVNIFMGNLWNAMTMFFWDDGNIWVHSVTQVPALDVVSAALFLLGFVLLLVVYIRRHNWLDIFLPLTVPMLMLPSILSLAFPSENPALNRAGGAIVPVFLIIGIALDSLMTILTSWFDEGWGRVFTWGLVGFLVLWSGSQNYRLVFDQYQQVYSLSSWNTSEIGQVIEDFAGSVGTSETAWVVAYPHWVDTRLVGMNAGYPVRDFAIQLDQLAATTADPRAKLFILKLEDSDSLQTLGELYPDGVVQEYQSTVESHNFLMYFVPPTP
jgi:hypothetical protein